MTVINNLRRMARQASTHDGRGDKAEVAAAPTAASLATAENRPTKQKLALDLLHRQGGASLNDLCRTTGWLPHAARVFLTGLRKKGRARLIVRPDM